MARLRPLQDNEVSEEIQEHFSRDRAGFGTVLNSSGFYAYCPPVMTAARALGQAVEKSGKVPRQLRCLLNVRAAAMVGCPF